jgi:hypothetical protein
MTRFRTCVAAFVAAAILAASATAAAQSTDEGQPLAPRAGSDRRAAARPDESVRALPVNIDRIRRGLVQQTRTRETRDGLHLQYYVDVYGRAPQLELFTPEENFTNAPVMYGGMTHQEFLQFVTPQEFRAPAADIPGAVAALVKWAAKKVKK